jgi:uncharacterized membrane protein
MICAMTTRHPGDPGAGNPPDNADGPAVPSCPQCGAPLPAAPAPTAPAPTGTAGRPVKVHTRNEAAQVRAARTVSDAVADGITAFSGSLRFVYLHMGWFAFWIIANAGLFGAGLVYDRYPYGLLTMIVSLEAIFLSTFVMISQNRQAARADVRSELDFETNLRSEVWSMHIGQAVGLDPREIEQYVQRAIAAGKAQLSAPPD